MSVEAVEAVDQSVDPVHGDTSHLDAIFADGVSEPVEPTESESSEPTEPEPQKAEPDLAEQIKSLQKQLEDSQKYIAQQGNEKGELRKQLEALQQPVPESDPNEFVNEFAEKPKETVVKEIREEMARREQARFQQEAQAQQMKERVHTFDPEFDQKIDGIKQWYREKGATEDYISSIDANSVYQNVDLAVALSDAISWKQKYEDAIAKSGQIVNKLNKGGTTITSKAPGTSTNQSNEGVFKHGQNVSGYTDKQLMDALDSALQNEGE